MKILVADKFEQSGLDALKAVGCDVIFQPDASGDALVAAIKQTQAPVLVVRSTQVTDTMMDAGALSLIVRAGAGVNTIDVAAASKRGVYVSNCPGKNSVAVADAGEIMPPKSTWFEPKLRDGMFSHLIG